MMVIHLHGDHNVNLALAVLVALSSLKNDLQQNIIAVQAGIAVGRLSAILFSLEMKGVVRTMAGGYYHLLG